jgi:uncharacterized protein YkwD
MTGHVESQTEPTVDGNAAEAALLRALVNRRRLRGGFCGATAVSRSRILEHDPLLATVAKRHATELLGLRAISHLDSRGRGPDARARMHGYRGTIIGEAVTRGPGTATDAAEVFFASERHCRTLMASEATHVGVALARAHPDPHVVWVVEIGVGGER